MVFLQCRLLELITNAYGPRVEASDAIPRVCNNGCRKPATDDVGYLHDQTRKTKKNKRNRPLCLLPDVTTLDIPTNSQRSSHVLLSSPSRYNTLCRSSVKFPALFRSKNSSTSDSVSVTVQSCSSGGSFSNKRLSG